MPDPPPPPPPPVQVARDRNRYATASALLAFAAILVPIAISAGVATADPERGSILSSLGLPMVVLAAVATVLGFVARNRAADGGPGKGRAWVAIVVGIVGILGGGGQVLVAGEEASAARDCQARDDAWARPVIPVYDRIIELNESQRRAIASGTLVERHAAQVAVWEATEAFGDAARAATPCSSEAAEVRLLAIELGVLARRMVQLQEVADGGGEGLPPAFFRTAERMDEKWAKLNRVVVDMVAGP